jgi:methionyl-tRNA formyltransferase
MSKTRVFFLGAGQIAVPILKAAARSDIIELAGAGTQPDKPAGRGRKLTATPAAVAAEAMSLPVMKIPDINSPETLAQIRALAPDILLVVSFGQLLKDEALSLARVAPVNIHASLLPLYRGASPISDAILNGDEKTGVAFMRMERGLDTGPVYAALEMPLTGRERRSELEDALGNLAAEKCAEILCDIASGKLAAVPQDDARATKSRKIKKEHGVIDWAESAVSISRKVRAFYPWPGAKTELPLPSGAVTLSVCDAVPVSAERPAAPGTIVRADKKSLILSCGDGALEILKIFPTGRKEMTGAEFVRGSREPLEGMTLQSSGPQTAALLKKTL